MSAPLWAFVCSSALSLLCLGSASTDDHLLQQREVTFDPSHIMQAESQPLDLHLLQTEMDLSDLLEGLKEQPSPGFSPRASRPRPAGPGASAERFSVRFPLARPSPENIQAICRHGDRRPRYPESFFPASGYGVLKRRADAVNTLEAWFGGCCGDNRTEEVTLCCATQAWEKSASHFCEVDFSIKAPHFHCCKKRGSERLSCFDNSAKDPSYSPTEQESVQPVPAKAKFSFDPQSCPGTAEIPQSIRKNRENETAPTTFSENNLIFPPAEPTDSNIESLCENQQLRPRYKTKCLAVRGNDLVIHQAKTINRLEKRFKNCCKTQRRILQCAQRSWADEMKRFCQGGKGKKVDFQCCNGRSQFDCFRNMSKDPGYNKTAFSESLSLDNLCNTHELIRKRFSVGFSLKNIESKCCHGAFMLRKTCIPEELGELFKSKCAKRDVPPSVRRCCRASSPECFNKIVMDSITKAAIFTNQKKKRCPAS